jgi:hypothetical protein
LQFYATSASDIISHIKNALLPMPSNRHAYMEVEK